MNWKIYAETIDKSKLFTFNKAEIIIELFKRAGCKYEPQEAAVRKWISGKSNCIVKKYFPDYEFKIDNVYKSFRSNNETKIKNLQNCFLQVKDESRIINTQTDNLDIFCWSLANQFESLLGIPMTEIPEKLINENIINNQSENNSDITEEKTIDNSNHDSCNQTTTSTIKHINILDEFMKSIADYAIDEMLGIDLGLPASDKRGAINSYRLTDMTHFVAHIRACLMDNSFEEGKTCSLIRNFCDILFEYTKALVKLSENPQEALAEYKPTNLTKLNKTCHSYTEKLQELFNDINKDYEEKKRNAVTTFKENWEKNTVKGSLFDD